MGCWEGHLGIVQDPWDISRKDQSWEKGGIKVDEGGKSGKTERKEDKRG